MGTTPNIFVSHRWKYSDDYNSLIKKFKEKEFEFIDYSVPKHDAFDKIKVKELEDALSEQVRQCNIFIIFANLGTLNSEWVEKELAAAVKWKKPIIAVKPLGYTGNVPKVVQDSATVFTGFNSSSIIRKIEDILS